MAHYLSALMHQHGRCMHGTLLINIDAPARALHAWHIAHHHWCTSTGVACNALTWDTV